ncbi:MAG: Ig-like domain-containing protein [Bryobacteraceae bacterium]
MAYASTAAAQTPSIIHILSDDQQVLVGRTLKMRAIVRDAAGNPIPTAPVTWAINQAAAGSIAADGTFTARGLATVRVTARSGSASGEAAIQTIPSRVEVQPRYASLDVGVREQFRAFAYDADGNVIPGVNFTWSVTNQRQGSSSLGRVDNTGMVTTTGEGGMWAWATYNYNESFPGLQRQWVAYADIQISVPKTYELRRLYRQNHQTRPSWPLRARQSMIWSSDDGNLFFNASLGGLANAFLNWNNGEWRVLAAGGVPRFGRGAISLEFRNHSVTRDGQILSYEDTNGNGTEINRGTRDGLDPFLNNNVPLGATEATSGLYITRNSYNSAGYAIVRSNFRFENNPVNYVGLFRGSRGPTNEMLVSTQETIPEFSVPFSVDTDFGIASDGTATYSLTGGAMRIFYRHGFDGRQKLIGVGDAILGSKVRQFVGGRGNSPSFWADEDGTVVLCVLLEDNTQHYVSFAPDGKMTSLRITSQAGILWRHPDQGTLLYINPYNNRGNGVWLWKGDELKQVYVFGRALFEQTIQEVESGTVDKAGNITLMLRGSANPLLVARMNPEPYILFAAGDTIPVELPPNAFTLIGGARTGPPHAQIGGNAGSIGEFDGSDWKLTAGMGERLFAGTPNATVWFGGSHGSTYNMRKASNGDVYFLTGLGIARIKPGGSPEMVLQFPLRIDNALTANNPGFFDVNSSGTLLFHSSTNQGDNRIFTYLNGQAKQLLILSPTAATATSLDGSIVQSVDSFAFDDLGRVMAQIRFRGAPFSSMAVWDGAKWTVGARAGQTRIGSHLVTNVPNTPRASGGRLLTGLIVDNGPSVPVEWTDAGWKVLVDTTTLMPNGQVANSVPALDINAKGDLLFQFANGVNTIVVRRGDKLMQVHDFFRPTPQGDYLIRLLSMDLRDDGTVYFLAVNEEDEVVLYEARPLQ